MKFNVKIYTEDSGVFNEEQQGEFAEDIAALYEDGALVYEGTRIVWFPPSQIRRIEITEKK
jgi:hypothetical protein